MKKHSTKVTRRSSVAHIAIFCGAIYVVLLAVLWLTLDDSRFVAAPALTAISIATAFWLVGYVRDGAVPIFDVGSVCVAATLAYITIPLIGLILADLSWSQLSDNRFQVYLPTPQEIGQFSWRGVVYLFFLATSYQISVSHHRTSQTRPMERVPFHVAAGTFAVFSILGIYFFVLQSVTGLTLHASYETLQNFEDVFQGLPLIIRQITGHLLEIQLVLKLGLLVFLFQNFARLGWRLIAVLWLLWEVVTPFVVLGGRTSMVLFVIASVLLYHRFVRPLPLSTLAAFVSLLFLAFLFQGFLRGGTLEAINSPGKDLFVAANEFQSSLATSYDIYQRRETGAIADVPWQFYLADIFRLIPQQLLPFEKVDPTEWYLELLGLQGTGVGFTFGVVAESILGFDWYELAARGAILGLLLAAAHKWYLSRSFSAASTLFYLWLCIKIYFTYRLSTFYLLVSIAFQFLPGYLLIKYSAQAFTLFGRERFTHPSHDPHRSLV